MLSFTFWRKKKFCLSNSDVFCCVFVYLYKQTIFFLCELLMVVYISLHLWFLWWMSLDVTRLVTQTHTRGTAFDCDQHLVMGFEVMGGANQSKHNLMRHLYLYSLRLRICRWHYFIPVICWKQKPRAKSGFYLYKFLTIYYVFSFMIMNLW